ncbi:NmrA-like family protein [Penicillium riverlandense]|uniref:NmrA-like family protein n=1 Tax=Penicillium riverlandense TaxID=1903569 RepID=UPI0025487AC0|nr:NmrA-like family protein [Penicillium riverlandense]KAJ5819567.1 NmrA-like family protein [Penicillium riverlandense]
MSGKIGIFPASGGLGTSIVNHLSKLVPASQLILIARHTEKLFEFSQNGATVRQADYDEPSTLDKAFDGVETLMLISYASFEIQHRINAHRLAIDAAIKSGVKHIFYSSLAFAGVSKDQSLAHVMGAHIATEKYLSEKSGSFTYTAVREGLYSESFPIYTAWFDLKNPADEITIPHPGSGPGVAWAKRDELGEATAKLVVKYTQDTSGFPYLNGEILLSGPRELSLSETVEVLGRAVGKPLKIREISVDEYASLPQVGKKHTYHGVDLSKEWATAWEAIKQGETAIVSPALAAILGREPEDFETTIKAQLE